MLFVMEFGGTSIGNAEAISRVVGIIKEYTSKKHKIIVIVSALPKVTDELFDISEKAIGGNIKLVDEFIEKQLERHKEIAEECISDHRILVNVIEELNEISREMMGLLRSIARLKELTPRSRDYLLSFGEKLAAPIVNGVSICFGLKSLWITGCDAGITTDEKFGDANPLIDVTAQKVNSKLLPLLNAGKIPIISGFGACSPHGISTTLGRGGSDFTATLIGSAINADEIIIWKDVEGLMTADPKIEPKAKILHKISYAEASEMAYFGAKVIHPRALSPVEEKQIPIRIRSSLDSKSKGTLVASDRAVRTDGIVKAVTLVDKVAMISVTGAGMAGIPGIAAKVFKVLGDAGINILMISQSSSEAGISFVVPRRNLHEARNALELLLLGTETIKNIDSENDVCVVAAVGAGMKGTHGVAARVFKAVADKGVNVRMIAQGSSELNISFIVSENDGPRAIRALHQEFGLGN